MPSLLKDRATGRLGRLISALRPARAGPLPVQTGFPTSLADLFVKNHGRLRKPSSCAPAASRRKKRGAPPLPTPPPSPAPSPPASSPPSPPPPAAVSPPTQPIHVLPPSEPVFCHTGGGSAFGLGLGFLALVGVVSLAILVIWSRKVVAAVTVAAFSLFLLESVRSISLRRRPRPPAAKDALDLGGRGYVSPIREVEAEPEPPRRSFSVSGRGTDAVSILPLEDRIEEMNEAGDDASNPKAKPKKRSWKKLIPRKLQKGRIRKEAEPSPSVSFRSESSEADAMSVGGNATAADLSDSRRGSTRSQADAVARSLDSSGPLPLHGDGTGVDDAEARNDGGRPIGIDASAGLAVVGGVGGGRGGGGWFPLGVPVIVVLVGLFAGRLPAVAFTVLCSALVSSLQRLSVNLEGR